MERDKKPLLDIGRLIKALGDVPDASIARAHPATSPGRALSLSLEALISEHEQRRETIIALKERLAVSEELVIELKKELARKDGRSSGEEGP